MKLPHADLTKVTRVILVHQNSVVVHASGIASTAGVSSVLADTSVARAHVASLLSVVVQTSWLRIVEEKEK